MAKHSLRDPKTGRFITKAEYQKTVGQAKKIEKAFQKLTEAIKKSKKPADELHKSIRKAIKVIVDDAPKANNQIRQMDIGIKRLIGSVKTLIKPAKAVFDIFMKMTKLTFGGIIKLFGISTLLSKLGSLQGLNTYNYRATGQGTTATRLRGLERTEAVYGIGGDLSSMASQMQENVYNPSKWASLQTLTGVDMLKFQGKDSISAMWEMLKETRDSMRQKGITSAGSVEYQAIFKQFADNLGMTQEMFNNLLKGNNLEQWMNEEAKATKITEGQIKIEQQYTRTMQRLQDTMQRFAVTFAGPILKLANRFISEINKVLKGFGKKETQKAMDMFVNSIVDFTQFMVKEGLYYLDEFVQWFKTDGIKDLKAWFQFFKDRMNEFRNWFEKGGDYEIKALWEQVKNIAKAISWVATSIIPTFASGLMELIANLPGTGIKKFDGKYMTTDVYNTISKRAREYAPKIGLTTKAGIFGGSDANIDDYKKFINENINSKDIQAREKAILMDSFLKTQFMQAPVVNINIDNTRAPGVESNVTKSITNNNKEQVNQ